MTTQRPKVSVRERLAVVGLILLVNGLVQPLVGRLVSLL